MILALIFSNKQSGFSDEELKELTKKVQSLGGSVTALADDASHLVTNKFIRTIKWFVAMNKGMVQF